MRRFLIALFILFAAPTPAQEALNLPTELYVLLNDGVVERYGLGTAGVERVTPDTQFVVDFAAAPDGSWLAYRTPDALVASEVGTGEGAALRVMPPLPLTRGGGATLAWSPDARALAYTTETGLVVDFRIVEPPTQPGPVEISTSPDEAGFAEVKWSGEGRYLAARAMSDSSWIVYDTARAAVTFAAATPPANDAAWLTDGLLAYAPTGGGVSLLNVAVGNARSELTSAVRAYDVLAGRSGALVAFSRPAGNPNPVGRYTVVNPSDGSVTILGDADVDLDELRWTPGGELAVAFRGGVLALVNPTTGEGFPLPLSNVVAYGWGPPPLPTVVGYPVPANLFFIAADETGVEQVWQLFRDGSPPISLTSAAGDVTGYALSPGGFAVAYSSTDSGLWLQTLNTRAGPVQLADRLSDAPAQIDFSPEGTTLAYTDDGGIWTVPTSGTGDAALLLANVAAARPGDVSRFYSHPRYAANIGALLLDVAYQEGGTTGVLDLASGELRELPYGYSNARWTYDGDIFTFGGQSPLTQAGVQRTTITDLENSQTVLPADLSVADAVLIPRRRTEDIRLLLAGNMLAGPTPLRVFDYRDGAGLVPVVASGFATAPQLSPDGATVAGYIRTTDDAAGGVRGRLVLLDVDTGQQVALASPATVTAIQWQR